MENTKILNYKEAAEEGIAKIASLVQKINNDTEHAAFMEISGHVQTFGVSVALSKADYKTQIYSVSFISLAPSNYEDEPEEDRIEYEKSDWEYIVTDMRKIILKLEQILLGSFTKMVRIDTIEALNYNEVYVKIGDEYQTIQVDASGQNHVYDIHGKKYEDVYIKVKKEESDGAF